jgi:hypothetical protein
MLAFWTRLPKFVQKRGERPPMTSEHWHVQINDQLDMISVTTLEYFEGYNYRDLVMTALGLAKIVKQVGHCVS